MKIAPLYLASAWYWQVAGDTNRVWSSASGAYVPTSNTDFQAWQAAGGVATRIDSESSLNDVLLEQYPAGAVSNVPQQVSIMQAVLALHAVPGSGPGKTLLDDVEAAVAAAPDARIPLAWKRATVLDRRGTFVLTLAAGLGLNDAKLDELFTAAATISV